MREFASAFLDVGKLVWRPRRDSEEILGAVRPGTDVPGYGITSLRDFCSVNHVGQRRRTKMRNIHSAHVPVNAFGCGQIGMASLRDSEEILGAVRPATDVPAMEWRPCGTPGVENFNLGQGIRKTNLRPSIGSLRTADRPAV
jgi:hypothetical protein